MTRVQIFRSHNGAYRSFTCTGHTDFTKEGADVVCAGVSALVITTINSLQDLLHEDISVDYDEKNGGDITVNVNRDLSDRGQFLMEHLIYGLEYIRRQYGRKYLDYDIKEV